LYRELIKIEINPLEADQMELWQIAELMKGGGKGSTSQDGVGPDGQPMSNEQFELDSNALLHARVAAAKAGQEYTPDLAPAELNVTVEGHTAIVAPPSAP
jgi:hypothetical protein